MLRRLYSWLYVLLLPLLLLRMLGRSRKAVDYRRRLAERLGYRLPPHCDLWVHAVSVGESVAAVPLIEELLQHQPGLRILVTGMTPTGAERIRTLLGDRVTHRYLPWDHHRWQARLLNAAQPRLLLIMETELWPNLLAEAQARKIPVVVANARLSARSAAAYARLPSLVQPMLNSLQQVLAQDEATAQRYRALGLPASRVAVCGSLKFDTPLPAFDRQALRERLHIGARPVWVVGSSHAGEEALILAALPELLAIQPELLLILVPRHPERFAAVARDILAGGWTCCRRSAGELPTATTQIWLGDSMGELTQWYALADVALVAGSLLPHLGGHNVLEPMALAVPTLCGPYVMNFQHIVDTAVAAHALLQVAPGSALVAAVASLLRDDGKAAAMRQAAHGLLLANRGALQRQLQVIEPYLISDDAGSEVSSQAL